jgi:hypothetical protein
MHACMLGSPAQFCKVVTHGYEYNAYLFLNITKTLSGPTVLRTLRKAGASCTGAALFLLNIDLLLLSTYTWL